MKATVMLLAFVLGAGLASVPATEATEQQNQPELVKYYYGLPGSDDYVLGPASEPQATDAWAQHSTMPTAMMDNAAATNGSHVYVAAGYSTGYVLYRHAVGSTTWETMAPCPLNITTGGAAIIGDTFYYCGGYAGMSTAVDTLFKYSISGNNWTSAPGPHPGWGYNWSPTIVACAGKLYYCSGCSVPGATAPTTRVWRYTPGSGWTQVANMNSGRVFAMAVAYHDTIWMAGGNKDGAALTHTEFYDPVSNTWNVNNTVFPQLPEARWGAAVAQVGDKMVIASGVTPASALTDTAFVFDFTTRTWSVEEGIPTRVYRTVGVGNADNKAVVYGGSTGGFTPTNICQYNTYGPPPAHDMSLDAILAPGTIVPPGAPLSPTVRIKNLGAVPESNIPVTCWIDSGATRVYNQTVTYAGPVAPGATAEFPFASNWTPGPSGATYQVKMFTALAVDTNRHNDTLTQTTVSSDKLTVLWLYSDYGQPDTTLGVRLLALGDTLVYRDVQYTTPTISELLPYAVVGAHSNYPYADTAALGNVLAAYVDSGGGVVLGHFSFATGWGMGGRIMTGAYATIGQGANTHSTTTLGWNRSGHPVMAGVDSCREYFAASAAYVTTDSVANWADGRPYVGVSSNQKVVGVNSYPGIYTRTPPQRGGDWALVFHNALRYVAGMTGTKEFDPFRPALHVELEAAPVPARGRVVINYAVAGSGLVEVGVYDQSGRLVQTVFRGNAESGINRLVWNMTDSEGRSVPAGVYFCKLVAGDKVESQKLVVH
ncbi:MAG: T9SS type A sorting domain-containing protein [candidate division WOR-3 bacterium]